MLLIEIPLGLAIALCMPRKGPWVSVCLVLMALPLLIPWNVVGAMWNIMALPDIGLLGKRLNCARHPLQLHPPSDRRLVHLILMDVWHWTSLVVLLCYAGLVSIPDAYYQAAKIDGARPWAVFRYIQLPKLKHVLTIAILLRFMDILHDLHRGGRADRRRPGQLDDVPVDRPGARWRSASSTSGRRRRCRSSTS